MDLRKAAFILPILLILTTEAYPQFIESAPQKMEKGTSQFEQKKESSANDGDYNIVNFKYLSETESARLLKKHRTHKIAAYTLSSIGTAIFLTGAGLFIYGKAANENSPSAQYSLILGGLTILNAGIAFGLSSDYFFARHKIFKYISEESNIDNIITPEEYYKNSGMENHTRKMSAKSFRNHGIALMLVSIPMFAATIYSFIDTRKYLNKNNKRDEESIDPDYSEFELCAAYFMQIPAFAPAIVSFVSGAKMLAKAADYKKLPTEPDFTLTSITPVINPVSRTYGLALGFSF